MTGDYRLHDDSELRRADAAAPDDPCVAFGSDCHGLVATVQLRADPNGDRTTIEALMPVLNAVFGTNARAGGLGADEMVQHVPDLLAALVGGTWPWANMMKRGMQEGAVVVCHDTGLDCDCGCVDGPDSTAEAVELFERSGVSHSTSGTLSDGLIIRQMWLIPVRRGAIRRNVAWFHNKATNGNGWEFVDHLCRNRDGGNVTA